MKLISRGKKGANSLFDTIFWDRDRLESRAHINDNGSHYVLSLELGEFEKEDVEAFLDGHVLVVKATKEGSEYCQSMLLPRDASRVINARFLNGKLDIDIPKIGKEDSHKKIDIL